jgi:flagellar hook-associated protein 2
MTSINSTGSSSSSSLLNAINSINTARTSKTRITGLYSGLDTDALVKEMLATEQAKLDRIYQDQTKLQWKYDAYTAINTQLKDFRTKYMSATSADNMYTANTYKAYKVSIASNNYVNVTATSNAIKSSHVITSVKLASAATLTGTKYRSQSAALTGTAGTNMFASVTGTKKLQADAGDVALKDLKYEDGTAVFNFTEDVSKVSFSINGKTFEFSQDQTLNTVMNTVNADSTANATMSLTADGAISIKSDSIGANSNLSLANVSGGINIFGDDGTLGIATGAVAKTNLISDSMTLNEIEAVTGKSFGLDGSGNVSFTINGQTFSFSGTQTLKDVMDTVNANAAANVKMTYDKYSDTFSVRDKDLQTGSSVTVSNEGGTSFFSADGPLALAEGTSSSLDSINAQSDSIRKAATKMGLDLSLDADGMFSFTINGKAFSFDPTTTSISDMVKKVNADADANVTMSYSSITDSFVLQSDVTGSSSGITVSNGAGVNAFGDGGLFGMSNLTAAGSDAEMMIDGEKVTNSSNTFTIDGMTFELKAAFDSTAPASTQGSISFNVDQDIDSVVTKVKNFITAYNEIVKSLNDKVHEKIEYDYSVLTEAQRDELNEDDLEKWDEKAMSGILRNDNKISTLLSDMRSKLFQQIGDTGLSASDIGLTTGTWSDYGQISLDETKLRNALQNNADAVAQVFVGSTTSTDAADIQKESGIITSFFKSMTDYSNDITKNTLSSITTSLNNDKTSYSELVKLMAEKEDDYYAKFTAMETAISQYNAQSTWLTQQIGQL